MEGLKTLTKREGLRGRGSEWWTRDSPEKLRGEGGCLMEWSIRGTRKLTENLTKSQRTYRAAVGCVYPLLYSRASTLLTQTASSTPAFRVRNVELLLNPSSWLFPSTVQKSYCKFWILLLAFGFLCTLWSYLWKSIRCCLI